MAEGVCVVTEFREGAFRRVSFEIASEGRKLANELGEPLFALALGEGVEGSAADLGNYGVEKVYVVDDSKLKDYRAETYVPVAAEILENLSPKGRISVPGWPPGLGQDWPPTARSYV